MTARNDDGFTLTEALVALLIISLSLAGVLETARFVARLNGHVVSERKSAIALTEARNDLATRLGVVQPIAGDDLAGEVRHMQFRCPEGLPGTRDCSASAPADITFAYVSDQHAYTQWPPAPVTPDALPPRLEAVLLRDASGKNLAVVPLPVEHTRTCAFDMISRTCRVPASNSSGE